MKQNVWQLVRLGGLVWSVPRQIRDAIIDLYGTGCQHVGIECLIAQLNKLLMHCGSKSNNGLKLKLSLDSMMRCKVNVGRQTMINAVVNCHL